MSSNVTLIPATGWTPLNSSEETVIVTNPSNLSVVLGVADSAASLSTFFGHTIPAGQTWPFMNLGGKKVFARVLGENSTEIAVSAY